MIPLWCRFLLRCRDRTVRRANASVADRIDWSRSKLKIFKDKHYTARVSLPLLANEETRRKSVSEEWDTFSHCTKVSCVHAVLEDGFLFPADPRFCGGVKSKARRQCIGVYSHQLDKDNKSGPAPHTKYATTEETFADQHWWSAEVIFRSPQNKVTTLPAAGGNDQWCHETEDHHHGSSEKPMDTIVLTESRLYARSPAAVNLTQMNALMRHKFEEDDAVEQDLMVDYNRRTEEANQLRKIQSQHTVMLGPICRDELTKPPLLPYHPDQDDCLTYLTEKGKGLRRLTLCIASLRPRSNSSTRSTRLGGWIRGAF